MHIDRTVNSGYNIRYEWTLVLRTVARMKMLSYEHSRYADHFRLDAADIRAHGFDTIVHILPEDDLMACPGLMRDLIRATKDEGFDVLVDPLSVGNVFGLGRHSGLLQHYPEMRRVTADGGTVAHVCPSSPGFIEYLLQWIAFVADAGADGILWDEPDFSPCWCGRCSPHGMIMLLRAMTSVAAAHGLLNSVALHCMSYDSMRDWPRIEAVAAMPDVHDIGLSLVPTSYANLEDGLTAYVRPWCTVAVSVADTGGKSVSVWAQGYSLPAGRETSVQRTIAIARNFGIRSFGYWGYRGCTGTGVACEDPVTAWENARAAFVGLD